MKRVNQTRTNVINRLRIHQDLRAFFDPEARGHDVGRGQNRQFGDLRHSVAVRLVLTSNRERRALGVEAKMQRVSAMLTYVVNEGRLCALKPSEWSILLAGVAICGVGTLVFLTARL